MKVYIKEGQVIGSDGYTDLKVTKTGLKLFSTDGAELDFYDNENDTHHKIKYDMDVKANGKKNPNFGKLYYEKDEDTEFKHVKRLFSGESQQD